MATIPTAAPVVTKGRRKWPWLLGIGLVAAGVAYALRSKPQPPVATEPDPTVRQSLTSSIVDVRDAAHLAANPLR